jgi:hypothetical protein
MTSTDAQISQLREAIDRQIEADKLFETDIRATLDDLSLPPPPPPPPPPTASPPLAPPTPEVSEDRYKKGWSDAWDLIMPQLYELQRRYILTSRVAADPWVKWLPIICFCCVLIGFVLGWNGRNIPQYIEWAIGH